MAQETRSFQRGQSSSAGPSREGTEEVSVLEGQPRLSGTHTWGPEQGPRVLRGQKCGRKEGSPSVGTQGREEQAWPPSPLPWYLAPWPLAWHRQLSPPHTPPSEASSRQQGPLPSSHGPLPSSHSFPVPREVLAARLQAKAHPEVCPTAAQAELLPFLPTSIQRNRGHATSTVCPSAEDGQQLVLSHNPRQPAEKSSSIRQTLNVDAPSQPSTPPHLRLVLPPTSLPRIIWSQHNAKLHLR